MSENETESGSFWSLFSEPPKASSDGSSFWNLFSTSDASDETSSKPCALAFNPRQVYWAMRNLPLEEATKHFLICGTTGSGKTITIRLFLQSIAKRFQPGAEFPEQLIVFDAKGDTVPLLAAMGLRPDSENVWILNPFDARSALWNLAEAVQSPVMARHLATLLVPPERHSTAPFFADAARELVYAVLMSLNHIAGDSWTFRDLLCALDSQKNIAAVTARLPRAKILANRILLDDKHCQSVLSTLATKLGQYEQIAALWHTNVYRRLFSIKEFLHKPGVLVLGNDPVFRESIWPLNAILLKALSQEILRGPETNLPRHWFVLDEFRAMERVDCIHDLLNRGRSKGASVLLGIQSVEGLVEIYGEQAANDILSQCAQKTFLRAGSPKTAEWAEQFFGKVRRMEVTRGESWSWTQSSKSANYALQERALFIGSFFLNLPLPSRGNPYVAVCDVPSLQQSVVVRRQFDEIFSWCWPPTGDLGVQCRTDLDSQYLDPWSEKEEERFCMESTRTDGSAQHPELPGSSGSGSMPPDRNDRE